MRDFQTSYGSQPWSAFGLLRFAGVLTRICQTVKALQIPDPDMSELLSMTGSSCSETVSCFFCSASIVVVVFLLMLQCNLAPETGKKCELGHKMDAGGVNGR